MASNLTRFDPFKEIARFEPFQGFDDLFKDISFRPMLRNLEAEPRIKMDISETDQLYMVKAEIPGVKKEDIKISVEGNQVSISAEMKKEKEEKQGESVVRSERYYGQQSRSFMLAHELDDTKAEARYQDGVLELRLPKKAGTKAKSISVS